jgi:hypothetical protein
MRKRPCMRTRGRGQQGYALLVVMFLLTLLVLMTITVAPNVLTDARREKETEMVWRGKQYARGIKRYYMKLHRFPTELDDLTKPKTGIRFMRQAYKDPMNDVDGSWRLIYVGPSGQLIGSLKNRNIGGPGVPAASLASSSTSSSFGSSSFGGSSFGRGNSPNSSMGSSGFGSNAANPPAQPTPNQNGENPEGTDADSGQEPAGPVDTPVILGGNIIGVGSKVNKKSFLWYEKAKNYREFEFIWDPSKDLAMALGAGVPAGGGPGMPIGAPGVQLPVNQNPSPTSPNQQLNNPQDSGPPLQAPPQNQN